MKWWRLRVDMLDRFDCHDDPFPRAALGVPAHVLPNRSVSAPYSSTSRQPPHIHPLVSVVALHYFAPRAGFNKSERASSLGVSCAASCGARRASVTS